MGRNKILRDKKEEIVGLYYSGLSLSEIASRYNVGASTINCILKECGVCLRKRKYSLNENYFDIIDTQNKAYILGLLYADGCNHIDGNTVSISLQEEDRYILDKINSEIGSNRPLLFIDYKKKNNNYKNQYRLFIASKYICNVLNNYGMCKAKSLVLNFPECLTEEFYPHFIRGYFDGDGCVYYDKKRNKYHVQILGTKQFCQKLSELLCVIDCKHHITHAKHHNENTIVLEMCGNKSSFKFLSWIYQDAEMYLTRKYSKYISLNKMYNENNTHVA